MYTREPQLSSFRSPTGAPKTKGFAPRPFEVTFPGQERISSPTNPFPPGRHEVWMGEPKTPAVRQQGQEYTESTGLELDWNRISLYAEAQPLPEPPRWSRIQAKPAIDRPGDLYELESDPVVEQGMKRPDLVGETQTTQPTHVQAKQSTPLSNFSQSDWFSHAPQRRPIPNLFQAKLTVGQPNDVYEQEADRVAEKVMSIPESASVQREMAPEEEEVQTKPLTASITPLVQREAMSEEEEVQTKPLANTLQRQEMPKEEEAVQTKPSLQRSSDGSLQAGGNLESRLNSSKGGGSPLPQDVKTFMESRFRTDFSQVRVHTGSEAVQMNRDLNAQAFTHRQDVYFGAGKAPGNDALTAHELTHVVQQTGAVQRELIQRDGNDDNKLVDFDHELELPIELKDKKGQTVFTQAAELTLSLNTRALYTAKSSKFKFSFGKLKLATVVSAASEMDGGVASTNTETAVSVGASATIFSAKITRPSLFLPVGSELKLGGAWSGTFNSDGSYESKTKPKLVFIIPITKGQYEKSLEVEATPGGGMFKFTGTF